MTRNAKSAFNNTAPGELCGASVAAEQHKKILKETPPSKVDM